MAAPSVPVSAILAAHVAEFPPARLPAGARHAARRALLDGTGVMLAATGLSPEAAPFLEIAAGRGGGCPVPGTSLRTDAGSAALAMGALSHALDYEDAFDAAPCHPNAALIPALMAVAGERGGVDADDLLAALAVGCDVVCRMALSLTTPMEVGGWYPPPILGGFGAVAGVARLMGLNAQQVMDAWSLMLCRTGCPGEIKHDADTILRAVREAFPAQTAIEVCALAARGVRGFAAPLEGKAGFYALYAGGGFDAAALTDGLAERFWIDRLSFKRWPACRGTHPHIEAVRRIAARRPLDQAAIASVMLEGPEVQRMLVEPVARKRRPATVIDAKFSLPFTVAAAIVRGDVTLDSFTPDAMTDPAILEMADRIGFHERADWGRPQAASGVVEIQFTDGSVERETVMTAAGHPDAPLNDAALADKFVDCAIRAARPWTRPDAEHLAALFLTLGDGAAAASLFSALFREGVEALA